MKRIIINALVDIAALILFIPSLITGLVLYLVLPSGSGRGNNWSTYLGVSRHDWLAMHNYTSLVFAALIIIHLILHLYYFWNIKKCLNPNENSSCDMPNQ